MEINKFANTKIGKNVEKKVISPKILEDGSIYRADDFRLKEYSGFIEFDGVDNANDSFNSKFNRVSGNSRKQFEEIIEKDGFKPEKLSNSELNALNQSGGNILIKKDGTMKRQISEEEHKKDNLILKLPFY